MTDLKDMLDYPQWICAPCGEKHGRKACGITSWHEGDACDICGDKTITTEPRDYGHLKDTWKDEAQS